MKNFNVDDVLAALNKAEVVGGHIPILDIPQISGRQIKYISGYSVYSAENAAGNYERVVCHDRTGHVMRIVHLNEFDELCLGQEAAHVMCSVKPDQTLKDALKALTCLSDTVLL